MESCRLRGEKDREKMRKKKNTNGYVFKGLMLRMFLQVPINQLKESHPALPRRCLLRRLHVDPVQNLQKVE